MAKVLMIHPDKCTGCRNCELACSFEHERRFRPSASRVQAFTWEREGISVPMMCQQCDDASCVTVCPTGAMHKSTTTQAMIDWDDDKCIRCRMCVIACPFGNARYDALTSSIFKCDNCDGSPQCAAFCPTAALEYVDDTAQVKARKKAYAAKFKDAFQEVS